MESKGWRGDAFLPFSTSVSVFYLSRKTGGGEEIFGRSFGVITITQGGHANIVVPKVALCARLNAAVASDSTLFVARLAFQESVRLPLNFSTYLFLNGGMGVDAPVFDEATAIQLH